MKQLTESDFRNLMRTKGFQVNYHKEDNENGFDIVALKEGYSFLIEFKRVEKRDTGIFRYTGDVLGDILVLALPCGGFTTWNDGQQSLTKTCRFLNMFYSVDI